MFSPKDATAIVMDPRTGAILALANWPQVERQRPGRRLARGAARPRRELRLRTGLDVQGGHGLGRAAAGPDHARAAASRCRTRSRSPTARSTTTPNTAKKRSRPRRSSPARATSARSRSAKSSGATRFNSWVHRFGFGAPTGVGLPGEEPGLTLRARPLLRLLDGQPPDRPGRARDADADGRRPTPRSPTAASCARRTSSARSEGARARCPPGGASSRRSTAAQVRQMLEGVLGPGGTASEVSIPGYELAGKTGTASKIDPETGEYSKIRYVASFIGFAPAKEPQLLCAVVVDEPQTGSIFGGTVAAPAFGQIMSFALPYLGIQPRADAPRKAPSGAETRLLTMPKPGTRDEARRSRRRPGRPSRALPERLGARRAPAATSRSPPWPTTAAPSPTARLFFCVSGFRADGHGFAPAAVAGGRRGAGRRAPARARRARAAGRARCAPRWRRWRRASTATRRASCRWWA